MPENPRLEELRRRVQADPASIAFAALAEEYRRIGHYEEAIETCRVGLQRHPAYLSARVTLGRALIELGEYGAAREELETVLHSAPENLAAIRGLAQIHERLGHVAEMHPSLVELANEPLPVAKPPAPAPVEAPPAAPLEARPAVTIAEPPPVTIPEPAPLAIEEPAPVAIEEPAPAIAFEAAPLNEPIEEISFDTALPQPPAIPAIDLRQFEEDIDLEPGAGPDPTALLVIARLERFLGAIQQARSATL
jgi:tetratricopeptide repeat protein